MIGAMAALALSLVLASSGESGPGYVALTVAGALGMLHLGVERIVGYSRGMLSLMLITTAGWLLHEAGGQGNSFGIGCLIVGIATGAWFARRR
jgi:hypothetical protein